MDANLEARKHNVILGKKAYAEACLAGCTFDKLHNTCDGECASPVKTKK